jgi:hypothetical protein
MSTAGQETLPGYDQDASIDPLTTVVGIGVIVILRALDEQDPLILTVTEKASRAETGKYQGDTGIIQETVKADFEEGVIVSEQPQDTLARAMTEVLSKDDVDKVGRNFHRATLPSDQDIAPLSSIGSLGRLEVVIYDGSQDYQFTSLVGEVENIQWRRLSSLLAPSAERVRETSRELLSYAVGKKLIDYGRRQYDQGQTQLLFPDGVTRSGTHRKPERQKDITVFMR